ncbi:MAG: DMT family transporter [Bacillota bacterium]|nr:DMT family transporter [Bacillota bacterium]
MYYILAFLAGVFTLISVITNSNLAKYIGTRQSTLINFIAGLSVSIILYIFFNNQPFEFINFPIWALFGGLFGVFIVIISNLIIPKIPTIYSTLLIFIGQLFTGLLIDYFQANTLQLNKVIGAFLIITGLFYNLLVDKKDNKKSNQTIKINRVRGN